MVPAFDERRHLAFSLAVASVPERLDGNSVAAALAGHAHAEWVRSAASQELLLTAAAPILVEGSTRGAVFLEQAGDQLLALRDRAVTRLFNLTLLATACAVIVMFGLATWISLRIGRLRDRRRFRRGQRRAAASRHAGIRQRR